MSWKHFNKLHNKLTHPLRFNTTLLKPNSYMLKRAFLHVLSLSLWCYHPSPIISTRSCNRRSSSGEGGVRSCRFRYSSSRRTGRSCRAGWRAAMRREVCLCILNWNVNYAMGLLKSGLCLLLNHFQKNESFQEQPFPAVHYILFKVVTWQSQKWRCYNTEPKPKGIMGIISFCESWVGNFCVILDGSNSPAWVWHVLKSIKQIDV